MLRRPKTIAMLVVLFLASLLLLWLTSCNATPTVPVPPPEFCDISPPDTEGICSVGCDAGQTDRNVALVYNSSWGAGVMQETEDDGSFTTEVEAEAGDTVVIQIKYGNRLSNEVSLTVPGE